MDKSIKYDISLPPGSISNVNYVIVKTEEYIGEFSIIEFFSDIKYAKKYLRSLAKEVTKTNMENAISEGEYTKIIMENNKIMKQGTSLDDKTIFSEHFPFKVKYYWIDVTANDLTPSDFQWGFGFAIVKRS